MDRIEFKKAVSNQEFAIGKHLFKEYAIGLGIDLSFQNFDAELEYLENQYAEPEGCLLIAYIEDGPAIGCFGIRKLEEKICELKRMYVKNQFRGKGFGKLLMEKAIKIAIELGYEKMRLDTLSTMTPAISVYKKFGFYEIESYRFNPHKNTVYFEKILINKK